LNNKTGDTTLESTRLSVKELAKDENADERIVVVLSDENFERYGRCMEMYTMILDVRHCAKTLRSNNVVK
jgi:hypothetical protein